MNDHYKDWPPADQDSGKPWSEAKLKILSLLWAMKWVEGSAIFKEIGQTYYDRRVRELRESGWQIETHSSGKKFRLISHKKNQGKSREYPNAALKRELWKRDQGICQVCGLTDENIQYDHKVPLDRHGATFLENLQLLCRPCNVQKRGVCRACRRINYYKKSGSYISLLYRPLDSFFLLFFLLFFQFSSFHFSI